MKDPAEDAVSKVTLKQIRAKAMGGNKLSKKLVKMHEKEERKKAKKRRRQEKRQSKTDRKKNG